jgi:hypothetical protein
MPLQLNWLKAGGTSLGYIANYIRGFPCLSSWHFSLSRQRRTVATGTSFSERNYWRRGGPVSLITKEM